jgi:hypothetical protein
MSATSLFFAQTEGKASGLFATWSNMDEDMRNQLLLVLLLGALSLGLLIWAAFYRKSKQRRRHRHRPHAWQVDPTETRSDRRRRHRERRRHSEHPKLPMNPTLAETGGLPPRRPEDQPPVGD